MVVIQRSSLFNGARYSELVVIQIWSLFRGGRSKSLTVCFTNLGDWSGGFESVASGEHSRDGIDLREESRDYRTEKIHLFNSAEEEESN